MKQFVLLDLPETVDHVLITYREGAYTHQIKVPVRAVPAIRNIDMETSDELHIGRTIGWNEAIITILNNK